jgi:WD40 repeat protein
LNISNPHQGCSIDSFDTQPNLLVTGGCGDSFIKVYDLRIGICVKKIKSNVYSYAPQFQDKSQISSITTDDYVNNFLTTFDIGTGKLIGKISLQSSVNFTTCTFDDEKIVRAVNGTTLINHRNTGNLECSIDTSNLNCCTMDESRFGKNR